MRPVFGFSEGMFSDHHAERGTVGLDFYPMRVTGCVRIGPQLYYRTLRANAGECKCGGDI
jgi:hypothetical protein